MDRPTNTVCAWGPCWKLVYPHLPWHPFCSPEHEQMAEAQALRTAKVAPVERKPTVPVVQLDLENAYPWQPHRFELGTLERFLVELFEPRPGKRFTRQELRELARPSIGRVNERNVTEAIRELRRGGWPIISSSGEAGYWLSWEPVDLETLEQTLRGRSLDMLRTLRDIQRARQRSGRVPLDAIVEQMEAGEI